MDRSPDLLRHPKVAGAPVSRPSAPVCVVQTTAVQRAAGVGLHIVENFLRTILRSDYQRDVLCPYLGSQESPHAKSTHLPKGFQDQRSPPTIHHVRLLPSSLLFRSNPSWVGYQNRRSGNIMVAIYSAGFVPVQSRSIAGEGDEISLRDWRLRWGGLLPLSWHDCKPWVTAPLLSRLGLHLQLNNRCPGSSLVLRSRGKFLHVRMFGEHFRQGLPQDSLTAPMDDPNPGHLR